MTIPTLKLRAGLLVLFATLAGCSTAPKQHGDVIEEPVFTAENVIGDDVLQQADRYYDPWQGFNRTMYRFNYHFDKYVFLPVVSGYQWITPDPVEKGIHNFFRNMDDITTLINSILQLDFTKTMHTTTRLLINSTTGLLGFLNIADDVPRSDEDFGQTLGYWGVGNGPYLVLPILGPSNLRDGVGFGVDAIAFGAIREEALDPETWQELAWGTMDAIDTRAHTAFRYYNTGSPVEYELVRMLYTTKRQLDIER